MNENGSFVQDVHDFVMSRKQALEDRLIIDLHGWATDLGYCIPLACSVGVWRQVVPQNEPEKVTSTDRRRIQFLLKVLRSQIQALRQAADCLRFNTYFIGDRKRRYDFVAVCGPGDRYEPVLTILTPEEAEGVPDGS